MYATVNKKSAARKVSEEAPATLCNTSSSGLYEEVVVQPERRVGTKVVRQSSKLRLSRALSAESFNLEDFDDEEAMQMWGGQGVSLVGEAEDAELTSEGMSLDQESLSENEGTTPNQEGDVSPKQDEDTPPKASKPPPPPRPIPYAKHKELQQLVEQAESVDGANTGALSPPSPSHSPTGSRNAPGTLRGSSSPEQWSGGPDGRHVHQEDDSDDEDDSDEDDDEVR